MKREILQSLKPVFDQLSAAYPRKGRVAKIIAGKHGGKLGLIFWHGTDKYSTAYRYGNDYSHCLTDAAGRHGYRIGVKTDDGEKLFTGADNCIVCTSTD